MESSFKLVGVYEVEHFREGILLDTLKGQNGIVLEGKSHILDSVFRGDTQITNWRMGLLQSGFVPDNEDTLPIVTTDEITEYTISAGATDRGAWTPDASAQEVDVLEYTYIVNSTAIEFSMTNAGSVDVWGFFLCDETLKITTAGLLWSTAPFVAPVTVVNGDLLKITYKIRIPY